jgi:hypothetical protein
MNGYLTGVYRLSPAPTTPKRGPQPAATIHANRHRPPIVPGAAGALRAAVDGETAALWDKRVLHGHANLLCLPTAMGGAELLRTAVDTQIDALRHNHDLRALRRYA